MRDEKRTSYAEETERKPSRSRPQTHRQQFTISSTYLIDDQTEATTSRELVLRLIKWVKHI